MIGQTVSHYKILEKLGEGGMGIVYRAKDTRLNREVALKFLPSYLASEPGQKERFFNEAQAASALNHPNVSTIHEIDTYYDQIFIAMEMVEGKTLKQIAKRETLPIKKALDIAIQIGEGLAAAAEKGIVHRDIKSDNIILTPKNQVKIMDFGLAKFKGAERLTQAGSTVGTAAYMSPEQASGEEVDHRSDLFSFGVVLYELLTGKLPFRGEHPAGYAYAILNEEPQPLARYNDKVSAELQRIVSKALAKNREERYQSVHDLGADLRRERKNLEYVKTPPAENLPSLKRKSLRIRILAAALGLLVFALLAYLVLPKFSTKPSAVTDSTRKMLAVLPFDNLGSPEEEYFADGITEEITTRLAKIGGLGVISHTSARKYKKTDKTLKQIGTELGADYILEGNIRWAKSGGASRIRINPQLIQVSDDSHLWAENYDAVLNDVFELQSSIAEKVATALDVALLEPERKSLRARPTENLEAYDFYLRGNDFFNRTTPGAVGGERYLRIALQQYQRAVRLDSVFALAYAQLSRVNTELYWHFDRGEKYLEDARLAVETAFQLSPDLPEAHMASGSFYYHLRDYEKAMEQFAIAQKSLPNNPDLLGELGYMQRRQGKWEDALATLKKAAELDPKRTDIFYSLGLQYRAMRKYGEAIAHFERAQLLDPGVYTSYEQLAELYVAEDGDTKRARRLFEGAGGKVEGRALADHWAWLDALDGKYEPALARLVGPEGYGDDSVRYYLRKAPLYEWAGRAASGRACYDSARILIEKKLKNETENEVLHGQLGIAYAGLGRKTDALREGKRAAELVPMKKDAWGGPAPLITLARIYVMVGDYDAAVEQLRYLLSIPSLLPRALLSLDPAWAPLRDHPEFKKLVADKS